jgi:hypothetical protein
MKHTEAGLNTGRGRTYQRSVCYSHSFSRAVVLTDIFPVAAFAATVGFRWPLCINHTKKAVKFKYTLKLYQYVLI